MNEKKTELRNNTNIQNFCMTAKAGVHKAIHDPHKGALLLVLLAVLAVIAYKLFIPATIPRVLYPVCSVSALVFFFTIAAICAAIVGYERGAIRMQNDFVRIGFCNSVGEAPYLIRKKILANKVIVYKFHGAGFPVEKWEQYLPYIEAALNVTVFDIVEEDTHDRRYTTLWCMPGYGAFADVIEWEDKFMHESNTVIVLGCNVAGIEVDMDLSKTPHWLIGGSTGMGKTKLAVLIAYQLMSKGAKVYIADWKGGHDYKKNLSGDYTLVTDVSALLSALDVFVAEIENRKKLFLDARCSSIEEYNEKSVAPLPRYVLILDETSLILDTTGCVKTQKDEIAKILKGLNTIARLARAFGLHLIVATQRPDVASIPGALKANLDGRLCSHMADDQSSIVILDDAAAAKLPKIPGRYIYRDGQGKDIELQAFLFQIEIDDDEGTEDSGTDTKE